jgi:hypothetical protein
MDMKVLRNFLALILTGMAGYILTSEPSTIKENLCSWLVAAGYPCAEWFRNFIDNWLALSIIRLFIWAIFIYLVISAIAYIRMRKRPANQGSDAVPTLAHAWAERGTWTPALKGMDAVKVKNAQYWFFGKFVEVEAEFVVTKEKITQDQVLVGFPFTPAENCDVSVEINGKELNAILKKHTVGVNVSVSSGDRIKVKSVYKTC